MKKNYCLLLILITLLFPTLCIAAKNIDKVDNQLSKKIDKIIVNFDKDLNIGVLVKNANTGKILYRKNANRYFMPASNEKLFTAFAALNYLGSNFIYQTRLFADVSKIENNSLKDDVYLQFTGDPSLTFSQLDHLINTLSQKGIHRIEGKLFVDDTAFDQIYQSPGTSWDDRDFYFGSPISALIIDHNGVKTTITPGEKPGQPTHLIFPHQPQFMQFINRATTCASTTAESKLSVSAINNTTYLITGCLKTTDSPQEIMMAIHNPRANAQATLLYLLKKNQIIYTRPIEFQKITPLAKPLANESSAPLSILIRDMLKESDNTIANSLFKTMGATYFHQIGSWQYGSEAVHNILNRTLKLTLPTNILIDGSGASRYNYITAQQIVVLLHKAYLSHHATTFITSLPVSGIDGTLKDRMNAPEVRGKIQAKTGTMTAVTALSGYLETQKKHTIIFSILINGFIDSPLKYKALEDQICTALVKAC